MSSSRKKLELVPLLLALCLCPVLCLDFRLGDASTAEMGGMTSLSRREEDSKNT